jgi:predicted transposase/invertase (TIGR01784 family)
MNQIKHFNDGLPDILTPTDDRIFKSLFTDPKAEPALASIISAYTGLEVTKATVQNPILPISDTKEMQGVFDVNCETNIGNCEVEMQAHHMDGDNLENQHKNIRSRSVYNVSSLHAKQESEGEEYSNFKRTFQITICNYNVFSNDTDFIKDFKYRSEKGVLLTDATTIIYVELPKFKEIKLKSVEDMTDAERWVAYLKFASNPKYREIIDEIINTKEAFQVATDILTGISTNPQMRAYMHSRQMFQADMGHKEAYFKRIGREEGEKQKAIDFAREMLQDGESLEKIARYTKLSIEKINALFETLN